MRADLYNLGVEKGILNYGLISLYYNSYEKKGKTECLFWHPSLIKYFGSDVELSIASGMLFIRESGKEEVSIPLIELKNVSAHLCKVNNDGFLVKIGYYNSSKEYCYYYNYQTFFESPYFKELKRVVVGLSPNFYDERKFVRVGLDCAGSEVILIESDENNVYRVYGIDGTPLAESAKAYLSRSKKLQH